MHVFYVGVDVRMLLFFLNSSAFVLICSSKDYTLSVLSVLTEV